jgi:UDP-N-acetylmuramate--alanine ligase
MMSLARVLIDRGWQVSGSDARSEARTELQALGVRWRSRQSALPIDDLDCVIHSPAVDTHDAQMELVLRSGIPVLSYPQAVAQLMNRATGLAVAGTHGKSTTTAMAAAILEARGLRPTVLFGGVRKTTALGPADPRLVLAEACEYRRHFLHLAPQAAVVLGIEHDHVDCFDSTGDVEAAFAQFTSRVPANGLVIANAACARSVRAAASAVCRVEFFGPEPADWTARNLRYADGCPAFEILYRGRNVAKVTLKVPGPHQVSNALAAAALTSAAGAAGSAIQRGLCGFAGIERRLEIVGQSSGTVVVDDYAHHPTEIRAGLDALLARFPGRPIRCVFQPFQASRTSRFLRDFARELARADWLAVTDVVAAREPEVGGLSLLRQRLVKAVRKCGTEVVDAREPAEIMELLSARLAREEIVVTMGAGNIGKIAHAIVRRLQRDRQAQ